jgi:hypothetical protein
MGLSRRWVGLRAAVGLLAWSMAKRRTDERLPQVVDQAAAVVSPK